MGLAGLGEASEREPERRKKLEQLGVRRLLLAIHDVSFPADPDEDIGRGSPATRAAQRLFAFAKELGFTGIQLGPQGQTSRDNASPYDGTLFSRHLATIGMETFRALVRPESIARVLYRGERADHRHAFDAIHALVNEAYGSRTADQVRAVAAFRSANPWVDRDGLHAALCAERRTGFRQWPEWDLWANGRDPSALFAQHARAIDRYAFGQLLAHEDHARVRVRCGLVLYGDLQVGFSDADAWGLLGSFLPGYAMGAPPSRTNPDGQPWNYPVFDPARPELATQLVTARLDKAFEEYDSIRIDHPHGLVCPWVYRTEQLVKNGTRLYESPDDATLAPFAIAERGQLDRTLPRHHDEWVRGLRPDQVDRYARLFDAIAASATRHGRAFADISCEVLSTLPYPLARVLERHALGRWRVIQKANLDDASDVYRTENARPEDWVMIGNHDTPPIFALIEAWPAATRDAWAQRLAELLKLTDPSRLSSTSFLATAMLAELFACKAENVSIFFADLFGFTDRFNTPGTYNNINWTLRLPAKFETLPLGLDIDLALDLALAQQHRT